MFSCRTLRLASQSSHHQPRQWSRAAIVAALLFAAAGCGSSHPSISGQVTYDGQPVQKGAISFAPTDGQGPTFGAAIENGRYRVDKAYVGEKRVVVKAIADTGAAPAARDPAVLDRPAARAAAAEELIPANAQGNAELYNVTDGSQTLDLDLMPPTS
jgi:hypothetical protein